MSIPRTLIFHILLSFRSLILGVSKLFSLIFLGCFCIVMYLSSEHQILIAAKIMSLTLGVIFTLIYWFYDYLVFYYQPDNIELRLYK